MIPIIVEVLSNPLLAIVMTILFLLFYWCISLLTTIKETWIRLLSTLMITLVTAYFIGIGLFEKIGVYWVLGELWIGIKTLWAVIVDFLGF